MRVKAFIAVLCLSVLEPGHAETIGDALAEAYANSPQLAAQREHLREAAAQIAYAKGNWRPTLTLEADAGPHRETELYVFPPSSDLSAVGTLHQRDLTLKLTQPLYRGGRTIAAISAAEARSRAERARTYAAEQAALVMAATSYLDVVRDESIVRIRAKSADALQRELDIVRVQFKTGQVIYADVAMSEARLTGSESDIRQADGRLQKSRADYARFVGHAPGELVPPAIIASIPPTLDEALGVVLDSNADIAAAALDAEGAQFHVNEVRGEFRPSVALEVTANRNDNNLLNSQFALSPTRNQGISAFMRITIPIYSAGQGTSKIQEADYARRALQFNVDYVRAGAIVALQEAWAALQAARERLKATQKQVADYAIALDGLQLAQRSGSRTVLDVLTVEREFDNARIALLEAQHDADIAQVQTAATMGRFTLHDLQLDK
jgi:outer membrane protein